ncbi:MAG: hypothetical protein WC889_15875 [Myxococcota bacterium]|jgi:hypothetical protein
MLLPFFAASCAGGAVSKTGTAATQKQETGIESLMRFYPMAVGNSWTYRGTLLHQVQEKTVSVVSAEGPWFVDSTGARLGWDAEGLRDGKRYLLRGPASTGNSWMSVLSLTSTERYEITATGVKAKTAAGTFEGCLTVRGSNRIDPKREFVTEWTYAPGVGIVLIETFVLTGGKDYTPQGRLELVSYRVVAPRPSL